MPRRPFDKVIDGEEQCHHCGAVTGEYHSLGCMAIATRRLFNAINNPVAAWSLAAAYQRKSPIGLAGWLWAALKSDPDLIFSLAVSGEGSLAGLKASHYDQAAHPRRYSVADVARALGCGKRLVVELERAFVGVGSGRETETLLRVN